LIEKEVKTNIICIELCDYSNKNLILKTWLSKHRWKKVYVLLKHIYLYLNLSSIMIPLLRNLFTRKT